MSIKQKTRPWVKSLQKRWNQVNQAKNEGSPPRFGTVRREAVCAQLLWRTRVQERPLQTNTGKLEWKIYAVMWRSLPSTKQTSTFKRSTIFLRPLQFPVRSPASKAHCGSLYCSVRFITNKRDYYHYFLGSVFAKREANWQRSKVKQRIGTNVDGDFVFVLFCFFACWTLWSGPFCPNTALRWTVDSNIDSKKVVYIYLKSHLLFECLSLCLLSISLSL